MKCECDDYNRDYITMVDFGRPPRTTCGTCGGEVSLPLESFKYEPPDAVSLDEFRRVYHNDPVPEYLVPRYEPEPELIFNLSFTPDAAQLKAAFGRAKEIYADPRAPKPDYPEFPVKHSALFPSLNRTARDDMPLFNALWEFDE